MRIKWTDRRFNFDFPAGIYPEVIERVRGTPARLDELLAGLPPETLTAQVDGRWSMQENAGHLLDLESLVSQRIARRDTISSTGSRVLTLRFLSVPRFTRD